MSVLRPILSSLTVLALLGAAGTLAAQEEQVLQQEDTVEAASLITESPDAAAYVPIPGFPRGTDFAVLRGDPMTGPFDAYIRLQPGVRIPTHFHSAAESSVGVQGSFTLEMQDGEEITLEEGRYTFIPWEMPHAATCPEEGEECVGFFLFDRAFDVTWVEAPPEDPNPEPGQPN